MLRGVPLAEIVLRWLPLAAAITMLCLLVELTVQQHYRLSAEDPQIALAEDLARGAPVAPLARGVDIGVSLAPWAAWYDDLGRPRSSTGRLDGALPELPPGLFEHARAGVRRRWTWQPRPGVRHALVLLPAVAPRHGFIAAGRSLREIEVREGELLRDVAATWLATLAVTLVVAVTADGVLRRRPAGGG